VNDNNNHASRIPHASTYFEDLRHYNYCKSETRKQRRTYAHLQRPRVQQKREAAKLREANLERTSLCIVNYTDVNRLLLVFFEFIVSFDYHKLLRIIVKRVLYDVLRVCAYTRRWNVTKVTVGYTHHIGCSSTSPFVNRIYKNHCRTATRECTKVRRIILLSCLGTPVYIYTYILHPRSRVVSLFSGLVHENRFP